MHVSAFQFLLVQLRATTTAIAAAAEKISIPTGPIESRVSVPVPYRHDPFQFLLVQLRAEQNPKKNGFSRYFNSYWSN